MSSIFKNWKTSLAGIVAGLLQLVQAWPDEAKRVWGALGLAVFSLLGMLAKDATNKNGKE